MDSGMISKIEKAKRYATETERIRFDSFQVTFRGDNTDHVVTFQDGTWGCDCRFFSQRGVCSHTMALERILGAMIPTPSAAAVSEQG